MRLQSGIQRNSVKNARHWRRSTTPEKNYNSRIPAFWNKLPSLPPSHNSLPSFQDVFSQLEGEKTISGASATSTAVPPIPLANDTEDGPLFRATVVECEQHIRNMKSATKRILKAAQNVLETRKAWVAAEEALVKELNLMKAAEPLVQQYLRPLTTQLAGQSETLTQYMKTFIIEPLSQFYGVDIKEAEMRRKSFDEESKEFYSFLSRYMSIKQDNTQKKMEADAKHEKKRRHFERKRLEYWNFLIEMKAGGSKGDEICVNLTNYAEKHCQCIFDMGTVAEGLRPELATIATTNRQRMDQHKARQAVENSLALLRPPSRQYTKDGPGLPLASDANTPTSADNPSQPSNASSLSISGIRDLEHQDIDAGLALGRRKEGFLFATSRPSGHNNTVLEKPNINWHKYWCVLSEGQLYEYSHWRKGVTQPHNDPINLRIATVRSCRDQDRRFCFEVITPKFRRVYQATSAEDMNSWINVISNAIQGLLNGTSSCRNLNLEYARIQPGQAVGRKRGGSAADALTELGQFIHPKGEAGDSSDSNNVPQDSDQLGTQLLRLMREKHPSNTICAECGAKNPDWCVINLGILVCIECSGIHRGLGTHISKVRSLTLDTTSYTKDLFEFIRSVGNNISNDIWEANLITPDGLLHKATAQPAEAK
ncbi:hypothetical protein BCR41DRAFT_309500, partial [Lobosporangium transversale]